MNSPVKHNTGHSFSGSSTKKNSLLLNMNQYTQYAPDGITDCDPALSNSAVASDLSNQACVLALARNKSSLIRVSGGENFGKKLLWFIKSPVQILIIFFRKKSPLTYTQICLTIPML